MTQEEWDIYVKSNSPIKLEEYMRHIAAIARREVYARGSDMLAYRVATLGGYMNNPNAWGHFVNQRLHDPHTQKETRELTAQIEGVINADRK
jgi:thymidylate synthase ThyX